MRKGVVINNVDYNADAQRRLFRDGLNNLTFAMEDEEGNASISSARIKLSNMYGDFNTMLASYARPGVKILLEGSQVFSGVVSGDGIKNDVDNESVELEAIASEKDFIERAKLIKIKDIPLYGISVEMYCESIGGLPGQITNRTLFTPDSLLSQIFFYFGYNFKLYPGMNRSYEYLLGGVATAQPFFSDITCYDMIVELVKIYNAVWWIEQNKDAYFVPKIWIFEARKPAASITLKKIRGTHTVTGVRVGSDIVKFNYKNVEYKHPNLWAEDIEATIKRNSNLFTEKTVESIFSFPFLRSTLLRSISAVIYDGATGCYLMRYEGNPPWGIVIEPASEILRKWYNVEILGTSEIEVELSLIDNYTTIPELIIPYRKLSADSGTTHFIRSAEIYPNQDKVKINAIGYEI